MFRTDNDILSPVVACANTVNTLQNSIPKVDRDIIVCSFRGGSNITAIPVFFVRSKLRAVVDPIGDQILGFCMDDISLHSI